MQKKQIGFKTKGMNRDLSVSAYNPEFAFENMNLRLSTNEGNTLMSWVNEKGTLQMAVSIYRPEYWSKEGEANVYVDPEDESWTYHPAGYDPAIPVNGTPIGTAVINHKLVLFTTTTVVTSTSTTIGTDYIYQLYVDYDTDSNTIKIKGEKLFEGNLNFMPTKPLETLVSYEAEDIQKVYWVDGLNQPRVINLMDKNIGTPVVDSSYFDFVRELALNETVTVKKMLGANGMFAPGVIQYAFTYYTKHGQESNIFYTTPLYYISHKDRGAAPDEKVSNAFKITVSHLDMKFDYLRIYSIQRTSLNGTPICKRVRDIYLKDLGEATSVSYTDDGMSGDSIDPTELLYKGGKAIIAETLEQKDNTLFLGNLSMKYSPLSKDFRDTLNTKVSLYDNTRTIYGSYPNSTNTYIYYNQLNYFDSDSYDNSTPCGGFKRGDYYRCGVQFQNITGEWSDPVWVNDFKVNKTPSGGTLFVNVQLPIIQGVLWDGTVISRLLSEGFIRMRPVIVFPELRDKICICQGVICPTMKDSDEYQSSYFFRTFESNPANLVDAQKRVAPGGFDYYYGGTIPGVNDYASGLRNVEREGKFVNSLGVDSNICTFHSPDIDFDTNLYNIGYEGLKFKIAGNSTIYNTLSDIDIQTESPTINYNAGGFVHKQFEGSGMHGIVSGLFYEDNYVNEDGDNFEVDEDQLAPFKWLVYPWQANGSLNNDINRPSGSTPTAVLKKKVISNLRFSANTSWSDDYSTYDFKDKPELFSSDEVSIIKIGNSIYKGNIDTLFQPDTAWGKIFAFDGDSDQHYDDYDPDKDPDAEPQIGDSSGGSSSYHFTYTGFGKLSNINTPFTSDNWWKTWSKNETSANDEGLYKHIESNIWHRRNKKPGEVFIELVRKKASVRMKYKSTPHLVVKYYDSDRYPLDPSTYPITWLPDNIPVIEIAREDTTEFRNSKFGGMSSDAFKENKWISCGEPVRLDDWKTLYVKDGAVVSSSTAGATAINGIWFKYSYGDTYFQRWDCLKTYAFTPEDINQIVEIGSFMLETRVNIDGRYDRNRGQINNLNMSPQNFNLMNDVYSQVDNFFTYRIMGDEEEEISMYPNQITWSKTKESGADTDLWTNLTLASVLEMDGDKGRISKLIRLNDQLLCFQDKSIAQILYNENVQIASTTGVPIEIANSNKVQGKRYLSNTIGCTNKWSIVTTPSGIYFMDNITKSIYLFNGELKNISQLGGMDSWCKQNIPDVNWLPTFPDNDDSGFAAYYDQMNQDVLFINAENCLAWSEKLGAFTSFYSYQRTPYFCNLDSMGIWVRPTDDNKVNLWKHRGGEYCRFFGVNYPYSMTLVGNPEPQLDKIFTNLEFRASVEDDGELDQETGKFIPYLPFDYIKAENDYQEGLSYLETKWGRTDGAMKHYDGLGTMSSLKRKFRIWRCDIPRCNASAPFGSRKREWIRNTWVKLKLEKLAVVDEEDPQTHEITEVTLPKAEIHDVVMTYFT